ncbi:MAG: flagellin [Terracidiphilus sp.]|jgi:flagellin
MSLGVLNNLSAVYAENNLNNTTNSLNTVLQQLSSGSKINSGADDAAGLSLVNGLQANQMALNQSQTNATEGVGLLQVADGALSQVTSLLNRAVTLATEASNGTLNSTQDTAANQEYQSILSEVNNIGTTTTFNQEQVFGSNTNIYTGDSSAKGAAINDLNIGSLSSANVGDTGGTMAYSSGQTASNVFIDLSNDGTMATANDSLGASGTSTSITVNYLTTGADGVAKSNSTVLTVGQGTQYANTAQGLINAVNGSGLGLTASMSTASAAGAGAVAAALSANYGGGTGNDTGIMISGVGVGTGTNTVGEIGQLVTGATTGDSLTGGTINVVGSDGKSHSLTLGTAGSTDTLANLSATINAAGYGVSTSINTAETTSGQGIGTVLTFTSANPAVTVGGTGVTSAIATTANSVGTDNFGKFVAAAAGSSIVGTMTFNTSSDLITAGAAFAGLTNLGAQVAQTLTQFAAAVNTDGTDGISATVNGNEIIFANTTPGTVVTTMTNNTSVTTDNTSTATTPSLTMAGTPTTGAQFSSAVGTLAVGAGGTYADTFTAGTDITIGSQTLAITSADNTLSTLASTINAGDYGVTATYSQANKDIVFTSANSGIAINMGTSSGATPLTVATGGGSVGLSGQNQYTSPVATLSGSSATDSSAYYNVGVSSSTGIVDYSTVVNTGTVSSPVLTYGGTGIYAESGSGPVKGNTGMVSDLSGTNGIATISYSDGAGQSLAKTDLSNQTDAQAALTSLNAAISDVSAQDGYIGAQINTLNSASSVLSTQSENVQSAQNAVQATDYASATSNMSKYEILSQTGISALAQANSMQQEVTKLLQ